MYELLKYSHVFFVGMSISGFLLRGIWMIKGSSWMQHRLTRLLPHLNDTLLLLSAVLMLMMGPWSLMQHGWLQAKLIALLVYIALGMLAFRYSHVMAIRISAWLLAVLVFVFMVSVAISKSAQGFLIYPG